MKQIFLCSLALSLITLGASISCSKKSSPTSTCKMTNATFSGSGPAETISITYNDAGQISTLTDTKTTSTTTRVYTYSGNTVLVNTTNSFSGDIQKDSVILNSDGLMISDLTRSGGDVTLTTYTYSGTQIQSVTTQSDTNPASTVNYTFTNGDLTGFNGETFSYNDKASSAGDYFQLNQLLGSAWTFIRNAHQCISLQAGNSLENFNYTYDNTGKITQMTLTGGTTAESYNYTYDCN